MIERKEADSVSKFKKHEQTAVKWDWDCKRDNSQIEVTERK